MQPASWIDEDELGVLPAVLDANLPETPKTDGGVILFCWRGSRVLSFIFFFFGRRLPHH